MEYGRMQLRACLVRFSFFRSMFAEVIVGWPDQLPAPDQNEIHNQYYLRHTLRGLIQFTGDERRR